MHPRNERSPFSRRAPLVGAALLALAGVALAAQGQGAPPPAGGKDGGQEQPGSPPPPQQESGQDAPKPQQPEKEKEPLVPQVQGVPNPLGQDPRQQELIDLFHKVERNLDTITDQLSDAGAGDAPLTTDGKSGLEDLLRQTQTRGQDVVNDIGRILELAQSMQGQPNGGGSQSQPLPDGKSPLDKERDTGPRQRESTPEGPREDSGKQESPTQPQGKQPDQPQPNPPGGENRQGEPKPPEQGDPVPRADDSDRWGFLPERDREIFRNQGGDDLPVQYREFIDSYYRRLNQKR